MYKRQGIKVTNKVVDDKFISYVAEGFQYIYTKDIKEFPVDLIVSDSDLYEKSLYLNDLNGFINETKNINRKFMVESDEIKPGLKFDFSNKEKNVMPDVKIGDSRISYGYSDGKLHIYSLRTPVNKRGNGSARSAMQQFLKQADNEGLDVYLDSSPLDNKTNGNKLLQFYKSLGFEETGKKINPVGDPEMVRKAKGRINESVELIAKDYIKCHGKNPAGIGTWIFGIGSKKSSDWVEFKGKFSEAKKQAIKQAEEKSVSKIYVMESLSNENIDLHYDIKLNDKGYRVAIIKENNEIAVTQAITLSGAKSIAKKMIHNILIDTVPTKSEFNIKEFKESVNKFKSNQIEKHTNISMQNPSNTKMNRWIQEARDYQDNQVWYHGSPSGKFIGAYNGLHVGTKLAATQALEARIGVPAEGEWDGTREYGKTLLAGRETLARFEKERGIYVTSGFNCCSDNLPNEDYYPTNRADRAQYSDGTPIKFSDKPKIFKVKINVPMSNTPQNPMQDFKANGYMQSNIKKGTAKRGYYYKNEAEDAGSISAVLPNLNSVTVINESVNESSDDPNIGRKWMNRYGDEIEIEFMKDGKYYTTKNGRPGGGEIIPAEQLERTIKVDTSWYNKKIETDKAIADQEAADLATKLAKDTEYSGIKGSSKLDTGRKIKALDKKLRLYSGEILTVKQIIDREIQNGAKLEVHNFWNDRLGKSVPETVLMSPDDTYFSQKNIGKIGLEYARQLLNSINEDLIQKTEQSIRTPFKAIKVDSYYMIKDNLGQYLHGEYTKEDADNLVKQLNAIGNVQFSINESVDDVNLVKQKANEALNRLKKSTSEFSQSIDFDKNFDVDDNDTPVVFRAAAAIQEIKNLGWDLIAGDSSEYSTNDSSSYLVVRKDDVTAKIRISNHSNATKLRDYPDVNIAPNEDTVWDIEDKLSIKYEEEHEMDESINESVKSFEIKYRSTSDNSKTEGSKVITAPDQNVARKRFTEDNPELKNLQIISITEVTDKI